MFGCEVETPAFWDKRKHGQNFHGAPLHAHDVHELYFLINGSTKYFTCDEFYSLRSGDMFFVPQATLHQTEYDNNAGVERVTFSFGNDFIDKSLHGFLAEMAADKHIRFDSHGLLRITDIVNKIEKENQNNRPGNKEMQRFYFHILLIYIARYRKQVTPSALSAPMLHVQEILTYINENYHTNITLASLSTMFAISPSHLSKCFKSVTGLGVKEYITVSRINAAKKLLETTDLPVTAIAAECGFNDSNYFAAIFKKVIGTTPKKHALLHKQETK